MLLARVMAAVALAVVALTASGAPAAAHWQYTRWGMSPAQVMAASEGTAAANTNRLLDAEGVKAELTAPYKGAQLPFTAVFLFDDKDQLQDVTLEPASPGSCPVVLQMLTANHGTPQRRDSSDYATTIRWNDLDNDNVVIYFDLGGGDCSIQYSKLPNTHGDGRL